MSKKEEYEAKAEALIMPILDSFGFSIYDSEYVKEAGSMYLRMYIDKPGGITIDDCEEVSRAFNLKLDEADFIDEAYIMEISSPGLGRKLTKDRHFEKSIGEEVEVKLYKPKDGSKEYVGLLAAYDKKTITITDQNGGQLVFERSEISSVRLTIDF